MPLFKEPVNLAQFTALLPTTEAEVNAALHIYGALFLQADDAGDEVMVDKLSAVIIHLRYRKLQMTDACPNVHDLSFIVCYEAQFTTLRIPPKYTLNSTPAPDPFVEHECVDDETAELVEQLNRDEQSAYNEQFVVRHFESDIDDYSDAFIAPDLNVDASDVVSEVSDVQDCSASSISSDSTDSSSSGTLVLECNNEQVAQYVCEYGDDTSDTHSVRSSLPKPVCAVLDSYSYEVISRVHGRKRRKKDKMVEGIQRATHFFECPESRWLSLLSSYNVELTHFSKSVAFVEVHNTDQSSLADLTRRAMIRRIVTSAIGC